MNKYILAALSVTGGIMCGLAWTDWCPGLILLFGFVPFFIIEDHLFNNRKRYTSNAYFLYLLPGFVIFSILTFGWIRVISIVAAISVILSGAFLMSFTMWLAFRVRLKEGTLQGSVSLVAFWLTLELVCLKIPFLSPWINLGNGLSKEILFIQWYEVTGTAGGTFWILLSNLLLSRFLLSLSAKGRVLWISLSFWLAVITIPSAASIIRYYTIKPSEGTENEAVIIQPNFDPYGEKFRLPFEKQLEKIIEMAMPVVTDKSIWLITPETTINDPVDENNLAGDKYIRIIRDYIAVQPSVSVIAGIVSFTSSDIVPRKDSDTDKLRIQPAPQVDYYNSAFKIDTGPEIEIYHKSKLVPGFEYIPATGLMGMLSRILPELGGINRGYTAQEERVCFKNSVSLQKIAPVICYESVFGEYVTDYIKKGAGAIFIITNDGWWKNTNGYKNHLTCASLRAIETRRPVVRAANTGVSCFIDIRGRVTARTPWWEAVALKGKFIPDTRITFYVKYGDFLMVFASILTIVILISIFVVQPVLKKTGKFE